MNLIAGFFEKRNKIKKTELTKKRERERERRNKRIKSEM